MSAKSWIAEFYKTPAESVDRRDAIKHSLKKWRGATTKSLGKHGLNFVPIEFSDETCALCVTSGYAKGRGDGWGGCSKCPLGQYLGGACFNDDNPFYIWVWDDNPKPMIDALEAIADVERICK